MLPVLLTWTAATERGKVDQYGVVRFAFGVSCVMAAILFAGAFLEDQIDPIEPFVLAVGFPLVYGTGIGAWQEPRDDDSGSRALRKAAFIAAAACVAVGVVQVVVS